MCIAQRSYFMAKVDQIVSSLQKLYSKRSSLDKLIVDAEKKLAAEAKVAAKPVARAKKPAAKAGQKKAPKPAAKGGPKKVVKPAAPKPLPKK